MPSTGLEPRACELWVAWTKEMTAVPVQLLLFYAQDTFPHGMEGSMEAV